MKSIINRKIRKLVTHPGLFIRDALINKYPLILNQCNVQLLTENIVVNTEFNINKSFIPDFNVDVVYTWVSLDDEVWKIKKNKYSSAPEMFELYATEDSRYTNHNEIYFSITSVYKYLPWVNNIYIVTDGQIPDLPEILKNKVKIIDHKDIIPDVFLPTFNSHVIEAFLHKIPNLADNFIYFNDDFFVSRELSISHFFRSNGHASLFSSSKSILAMNEKGRRTATLSACNNVNRIFEKEFNVNYDNTLVHTYVPLKKKYYNIAFDLFGDEIRSFLTNKFRSVHDLNLATFLVPYLQYYFGEASPNIDVSIYFNIRSPSAQSFYKYLIDAKLDGNLPHSFCANDFSSNEFSDKSYGARLTEFLMRFYE